MRYVLAFLFTLSPAIAQIADLATDYTGSTLLFWTRFRLPSETDHTNEQKVYRWRNGEWSNLTVYDSRGQFIPGGILNPFVANAGAVYGWTEYPPVGPGLGLFRIPNKTVVNGITLPSGFPTEYFNISSNGRYVAGATYGIDLKWQAELLDTQTGARTPWEPTSLPAFADDGTLAYAWTTSRATDLRIHTPGQTGRVFHLNGAGSATAISQNGQWAAVAIGNWFRVMSTSTGDFLDFEPPQLNNLRTGWRLSNTRALYLSKDFKQLIAVDLAKRESSVIDQPAEPFVDLALSGDGNVAWAETETNRVWRYDLAANTKVEVLPPLGSGKTTTEGDSVRGSAMLLRGKYTKGQTVAVKGQPWPISAIGPDGLWFQVPWEYRGPSAAPWDTLTVRSPGNPFESVFNIGGGVDYSPYFPTQDPSGAFAGTQAIAAHENFNGILTPDNPGRPGETIHVYMTGLGALERDVPTGVPGPPEGVRTTQPLSCTGGIQNTTVDTPLQVQQPIYAPGMIGFYQVDITIPSNAPNGTWILRCRGGSSLRVTGLPTRP